MKTVKELIDLLTLEKIDDCRFKGTNYRTPWKRVFGGQVLGQALHAAYQTVPEDRLAHSIHGYFILGGDIDVPIVYEVDTIRDGGSFTTRRVVAFQKDRPIFNLAASFQLKQDGFDHQIVMPNVLPAQVLLSDIEQAEAIKDDAPEIYNRLKALRPSPIEFRPVEKYDPHHLGDGRPYRHIWMKSVEPMTIGMPMQHQLLAYASDYSLLGTASIPHRRKMDGERMFYASLDHAMWFHRDFRMDEWLLYAMDSPSASNARGFARGSVFDEKGRLVASVAQEGLMRVMRK